MPLATGGPTRPNPDLPESLWRQVIYSLWPWRAATGQKLLTADEIKANAITANEIAANTITTNQLSATAIDGMTITGSTIRTAASGARIEMNSTDGLKAINGSAAVLVQISTAGVITIKTAATGGRVEFDATNGIRSYDGSNALKLQIAVDGSITVTGATITGGTLQTAVSPAARVVITTASGLQIYDASNALKTYVDSGWIKTDRIKGGGTDPTLLLAGSTLEIANPGVVAGSFYFNTAAMTIGTGTSGGGSAASWVDSGCHVGKDSSNRSVDNAGGSVNCSLLKVNSTQVVGAQGAAVADATDAPSTMARLNDLLARLRTHGLIAT